MPPSGPKSRATRQARPLTDSQKAKSKYSRALSANTAGPAESPPFKPSLKHAKRQYTKY